MNESIYEFLLSSSNEVTWIESVEMLIVALVLSCVVYVTYKMSFSSVLYNQKFNTSLVMITLITTTVMLVIGSNMALSLGMVGALSIVRFRTAIKDPRDASYIFWAIAVGLCTGTGNYVIGITTTFFLSLVLIIMSVGFKLGNERYILIVRADRTEEKEIMRTIYETFKSNQLKAKNSTDASVELVYQIKMKKNDDKGISEKLYALAGVKTVNVVAQSGETVG